MRAEQRIKLLHRHRPFPATCALAARTASARLLGALRSTAGACSGEALSSALGVSRAQVWKHVQQLRKRGYEIEGEPGGGYRLRSIPDRLYPEAIETHLETRWLARTIEHLEETDSTNRVASERGAAGAEHGYTVIAESQTAGRGRLGRSFFSPPHRNLYSSSILRPQLDTSVAPTLIPSAAIAVADTLADELGSREGVEIKWPNDVLLGGRKTSGILMEMHAEEARVGHLVLGIGINLNIDPAQFPADFRDLATSGGLGARLPTAISNLGNCDGNCDPAPVTKNNPAHQNPSSSPSETREG